MDGVLLLTGGLHGVQEVLVGGDSEREREREREEIIPLNVLAG